MCQEPDIAELIARARAGEDTAIREFLARFEHEVRIMVRGHLPKALRTRFDSMDFVQAVWQSFFSGLKERPRDFENIRHLRGFLAGVARNKVFEEHRRLTRTEKHAIGREERLQVRRGDRRDERGLISPEPTPSQTVQASDRLAQLIAGCSPGRGAGHHASPSRVDVRRNRRAHRDPRAFGPANDRGSPGANGG